MPAKKYFTEAERKAANVRNTQKHRKTKKGKNTLDARSKTDKYKQQIKTSSKKYEQSPHGKKHRKEFKKSDAGKKIQHKYVTSEKGRTTKKRWKKNHPDKVKISSKKSCKKFSQSENGKKFFQNWRNTHKASIKKSNKKVSDRTIIFKGKRILLEENPRKGVCEICKRSVAKGEIKQTNMHHQYYDPKNPLAGTIELCVACHNEQRINSSFDLRRFAHPKK